ncbi:AI-2E family transporter [Tessaracoccus sp. G1721]
MKDTPQRAQMASLLRLGRASWAAVGVVVLMVILSTALGAINGIVVPLVVAFIIGVVLEPLVSRLEGWGLSRLLASVVGLLVAIALAAATVTVVVRGFLSELPQIYRQLEAGWTSLLAWGRTLDLDPVLLARARANLEEYVPRLAQGIVGLASGTFSGALAFGMGTFFALFFLFFVLRDGRSFPGWLARAASWDPALAEEVATVVQQSLRGYFKGIAITALATAPIFMIPLLLLRVPLAASIFILYFVLSFIPFLGAWITGAFAVLIAFGSGGAPAAGIIGLTFLISNGTIQSAVSSWALGSALRIHPLVVLLSTLIGGTVAGLLGMVLAPPLVAAVTKSFEVVRGRRLPAGDRSVGHEASPAAGSP